jgi:hypothetical protein
MKGCKQMGHSLNLSSYMEALIQPLKVNNPKTNKQKIPAARDAQKCLTVIYPCIDHILGAAMVCDIPFLCVLLEVPLTTSTGVSQDDFIFK